ncbi:MAG: prenyltransferase/squalene oxidase repeat-containing protein [Planctomycetota bacterium]
MSDHGTHPWQELRPSCERTLEIVRTELLSQRTDRGHWRGELSSSALSTATAISAICQCVKFGKAEVDPWWPYVNSGIQYLASQQNSDGGFGDTNRSRSNIATSYLVLSASTLARRTFKQDAISANQIQHLSDYLNQAGGITALRKRYGKDHTFVVPILANMALADLVDWSEVMPLPFELAAVPQSWYRFMSMPVVSYAVPALVAIGQAIENQQPTWIVPLRLTRRLVARRTLTVLRKMQPDSGGYLEATPLTSFVLMCLVTLPRERLQGPGEEVIQNGLEFLKTSFRGETNNHQHGGSWPIDTDLATWVTSLSIEALAADPQFDSGLLKPSPLEWLLSCQHQERHPFTGASPGGWGWTDWSGAVPDADDTPAAMIACDFLKPEPGSKPGKHLDANIEHATSSGVRWLASLQNRDGGIPTFCRGWGKLPFDRSSTDLTAHMLRAIRLHPIDQTAKMQSRGIKFLLKEQNQNGSWLPLWFGNQDDSLEENAIYGTSRVLAGLIEMRDVESTKLEPSVSRGVQYLLDQQKPDGGWGGGPTTFDFYKAASENGNLCGLLSKATTSDGPPSEALASCSSIEETALAVDAIARWLLQDSGRQDPIDRQVCQHDEAMTAIISGVGFLAGAVRLGLHHVASPIGFYFAKLWYHEKLYPLIFTTAALGRVKALCDAGLLTEQSNPYTLN